ncbi:uncharacterized protein LOC126886510 isoform X2 [Diabrotica virgifera virgifera]|uniref:Uncharacterized protein LOC114337642 isoform X2 n=1 Tax=Diabrotica virgifera virgifera TaxID=50390 RepID=A0A6P7G4J6_DIAVI|nr:uncharacterized protein LOC126886510 isoform X2 [Diabrotica virgifera virgifera]
MEVKQEVSEETCKIEIENNDVNDALLDNVKTEIKEEPQTEITHDSFDYLNLGEYPLKTETECDEDKLCLLQVKQTNEDLQQSEQQQIVTKVTVTERKKKRKIKDLQHNEQQQTVTKVTIKETPKKREIKGNLGNTGTGGSNSMLQAACLSFANSQQTMLAAQKIKADALQQLSASLTGVAVAFADAIRERTKIIRAKSKIEQAKCNIEQAKLRLEYYKITGSFDEFDNLYK